jgi:hypothetical protein
MAYATSNPPRKIVGGGIDNSQVPSNLWVYASTDSDSTVKAEGYFSNGIELGMAVGDLVWVYVSGTPAWYLHFVVSGTTDTTIELNQTPTELS